MAAIDGSCKPAIQIYARFKQCGGAGVEHVAVAPEAGETGCRAGTGELRLCHVAQIDDMRMPAKPRCTGVIQSGHAEL